MKELDNKIQDVNTDRGERYLSSGSRPIRGTSPLSVFEHASNRNLGSRPIIKVIKVFKIVNNPFKIPSKH